MFFFFFFQAEDGIRDKLVTGVQTCALPILMDQAVSDASASATDVAAVGITNQRETTVLWDRATSEPVAPAIVWQDRRTAPICERLKAEGLEEDRKSVV